MTDGFYKCDRCGKFERGPIKRNVISGRDFASEELRKLTYGHLKGENESGSISRTIDLCHDCRKELTEWLDDD